MARIMRGRFTAEVEGDFVVFLIGMRINRWWKPWKWLPVFTAMPPMIAELRARPDSGLLGANFSLIAGGPAVVQYWRSFEHLEAYAREADARHWPAWVKFNKRVGASGDVGIWHETYRVPAGAYETIYGNMPRVMLAAAGEHVTIRAQRQSAAQRIGVRADDQPPTEAYANPES